MPTVTLAEDVHADAPLTGTRKRRKLPSNYASKSDDALDLPARQLEPLDSKRSKTPFAYQGNILGVLREDQVPRFFGALTDSEALTSKKVKLDELTAMQNRVDTAKVKGMAADGVDSPKLPVIVQIGGSKWIADGHHRLAAAWLNGEKSADVRFKNLDPETNAMKFQTDVEIAKVDESLGLVFGFAIVCKVNGEPYFDTQGDNIPEPAMLKAGADFMLNSRVAKEMHAGEQVGDIVFAFPLTEDIAKALEITTKKTGLLIAMKPGAAALKKFADGTYSGFSIGGRRIVDEEVA